jgi:hypothetical protein
MPEFEHKRPEDDKGQEYHIPRKKAGEAAEGSGEHPSNQAGQGADFSPLDVRTESGGTPKKPVEPASEAIDTSPESQETTPPSHDEPGAEGKPARTTDPEKGSGITSSPVEKSENERPPRKRRSRRSEPQGRNLDYKATGASTAPIGAIEPAKGMTDAVSAREVEARKRAESSSGKSGARGDRGASRSRGGGSGDSGGERRGKGARRPGGGGEAKPKPAWTEAAAGKPEETAKSGAEGASKSGEQARKRPAKRKRGGRGRGKGGGTSQSEGEGRASGGRTPGAQGSGGRASGSRRESGSPSGGGTAAKKPSGAKTATAAKKSTSPGKGGSPGKESGSSNEGGILGKVAGFFGIGRSSPTSSQSGSGGGSTSPSPGGSKSGQRRPGKGSSAGRGARHGNSSTGGKGRE